MTPLNSMDFAWVIRDKNIKETGLVRGDLVLVMGLKQVPASSSDPYLIRNLTVVAKVVDDEPQIPGQDNDYNGFLVDPRNLEKVSDELQDELIEKISEQHAM